MAKKEVKKTEKKETPIAKSKFSESERLFLDNSKKINVLKESLITLNQRIDRIVIAIDKSKKVRGL